MTPTEAATETRSKAVAVVGASSGFGARMLLHLEAERPDYWLVAIADRPMRWPVERVSSYRLAQNRVGGTFTLADIPDVMQSKAWDLFSERRELTMAEMPDVLQLENVDSIVHVGSHYDGPDPEAFIERTSRWVDAARIAGVRQFVYLSDIRTYGIGRAIQYRLLSVPAPTRPSNIATLLLLNPICLRLMAHPFRRCPESPMPMQCASQFCGPPCRSVRVVPVPSSTNCSIQR